VRVKIHPGGTHTHTNTSQQIADEWEKQLGHRREVKAIHYEMGAAPAAAAYAATQIPTKEKCHE
jgi:hypothetical protein